MEMIREAFEKAFGKSVVPKITVISAGHIKITPTIVTDDKTVAYGDCPKYPGQHVSTLFRVELIKRAMEFFEIIGVDQIKIEVQEGKPALLLAKYSNKTIVIAPILDKE